MARVLILSLATLAACKGGGGGNGDDSTGGGDDSSGTHPNVPPGYEVKWYNTDGCGEDGQDDQVYILAEGNTDASGNLTVTETWYWFFAEEGREDDCIDVFEYSGEAISAQDLSNLDASQSEEGYLGTMKKTVDGCPGMNYLYMWDHPDKKKWEHGDGLDQGVIVVMDTLTPGGNLNYENAMLVYMYYDVKTAYRVDTDYARGVFTPTTETLGPPAEYTWEGDKCLGDAG